jgi:hypothetical protein
MKNLYIIEYENAHWCGGGLNICVYAEDETNAVELAEEYMEESQRELFYDEFSEEPELDEEQSYTINSVSILDESNEHWIYYNDPSQAVFYPIVS